MSAQLILDPGQWPIPHDDIVSSWPEHWIKKPLVVYPEGEPIDMRDYLGMKGREAAEKCTDELFVRLQRTLDELGLGTHIKELSSRSSD